MANQVHPKSLTIEGNFRTEYIGKYGLLYACDVHPWLPQPDTPQINPADYQRIDNGDYVWVTTTALPHWFQQIYPRLRQKGVQINLVTGDSDRSAPLSLLSAEQSATPMERFDELISQGVIRHWYTHNCDYPEHPHVTPIALGIDYQSLHRKATWGEPRTHYREQDRTLSDLAAGQLTQEAWNKKQHNMLVDAHHSIWTNQAERTKAYAASQSFNLSKHLPERLPRTKYWKELRKSKFVLSPLGNGMDCHRTWEALILGVVPIVKRSTISTVFDGLPVIQVEDYSKISTQTLEEFTYPKEREAETYERLTLNYWKNLIFKSR